jgi:hypothetical protein
MLFAIVVYGAKLAFVEVLILLFLAAFVGLFYAWVEFRPAQIPPWRRVILLVGLCAATLQLVLIVAMWRLMRGTSLRQYLNAEFVLMFLALPGVFAWKSRARWWLLTASIGFGISSFFLALALTAY